MAHPAAAIAAALAMAASGESRRQGGPPAGRGGRLVASRLVAGRLVAGHLVAGRLVTGRRHAARGRLGLIGAERQR